MQLHDNRPLSTVGGFHCRHSAFDSLWDFDKRKGAAISRGGNSWWRVIQSQRWLVRSAIRGLPTVSCRGVGHPHTHIVHTARPVYKLPSLDIGVAPVGPCVFFFTPGEKRKEIISKKKNRLFRQFLLCFSVCLCECVLLARRVWGLFRFPLVGKDERQEKGKKNCVEMAVPFHNGMAPYLIRDKSNKKKGQTGFLLERVRLS